MTERKDTKVVLSIVEPSPEASQMWLRQIPMYILRIPSEALGVLDPIKFSWM